MANISVEFVEDKKIVRYPDGAVGEYPKAKIESHRQELVKRKEAIEKQIADMDKDLGGIEVAKAQAIEKAKGTIADGQEQLG